MNLEIVVHSWGAKYSGYLAWFLDSLAKHPPRRHSVQVNTFVADEDADSVKMSCCYEWKLFEAGYDSMAWIYERELVCNRAVLRHEAARNSTADWLWFTDVDYAVGPRFLTRACDRLAALPADVLVAYPRKIRACSSFVGRRYAQQGLEQYQSLGSLNDADFPAVRCGCNDRGTLLSSFFVRGDVAREKGYLADYPELLKPAADGQWMPQYIRDLKYLRSVLGRERPAGFYARWLYRLGN